MAEIAAGAVTSLLGVIRSEARLLRLVQSDVQFIREEMESMNSFLAHLARSAPPGEEHNEQVRTWMNQVRLLAQDCNNCIELYRYRRNPDIHRANSGLWRHLWWVPWFLQKLLAQHRAAVQLRELKDRARDVGERRLRYGVEVPSKSAAAEQSTPAASLMLAGSSSAAAGGYAAGDNEEEDDGDDDHLVTTDRSAQRVLFSRTPEDYVKTKLFEWSDEFEAGAKETMSIAIVAPDRDLDALRLAKTMVFGPDFEYNDDSGYHCAILVDIPALHPDFSPLRPKEVLYYILRQLKLEQLKSQSRKQGTDQGEEEKEEEEEEEEDLDSWQVYFRKLHIYREKKRVLNKIKENLKKMKVYEKLDKIKSDIQTRPPKGQEKKKAMDQQDPDVHVLLRQLLRTSAAASQQDQLKNKDIPKLLASDNTITKIAEKLKERMEEDEQGGGGGGDREVGIRREVEDKTVQEEDGDGAEKDIVEERGEKEIAEDGGDRGGGDIVEEREGGEGGARRRVENEEVCEEDCEGAGKEIVEEKRGGKKLVEEGRDGSAGDMAEECGGGRGEILEEHGVGGQGEILEEHGEGEELEEEEEEEEEDDDDDDDDSYDYDDSYDDDDSEEEEQQIAPIYLHKDQYVHILRQVFPKNITSNKPTSKQATDTTLGEDQFKQMIDESKEEIVLEPQEGKHDKIQEAAQNTEDIFKGIVEQKMEKIKHEFKEQLKIKGLVDDIKDQLEDKCPLFILKIDETVHLPRWEDTRNALTLLGCSADVLIVTTAKDIQQAKEYCYPQSEPIDYSLAGLYYDTVLQITKQQKNEENYNPQIFRNILEQCFTERNGRSTPSQLRKERNIDTLEKCEPNEFCMKIFAHALYINPKRSNEELNKLHRILQASAKSSDVIAKKMFKFSYTDMPKEYKSCLLYLAIFPPGDKIRRSTLIGRWVAEGLIFKEDWASSVHWANRCFDELISRCLVDPAETGTAGKVKSCVVSDLVHGFITKIARKQHIVETRLSRHLARHFSIFNDLQLRSSDKIDRFFQRLSRSSRVSLIKVLDLEGCQCFGVKSQHYLEDICSKMLLLKYLSLRGTDVTQLPSKINNLRELEVLDIRQTNVPMNATANVLLLKLKRLLAGNTDRSPRPTLRAEESVSTAVQIPHKIEKMLNMEVLSNVKARSSRDLKDIGNLSQLRKLGVVVDDDPKYLKNLLRAISDLHECLCSLSITLPTATSEAAPSQELPEVPLKLKYQPKLLESLSISGTTQKGYLLPLFVKDANNNLVKLTLSSTSLYKVNLTVIAKLPKLQFIRLRHIESTDIDSLVFEKDDFIHLKYLLVEGSSFTKIIFEDEAACMLEKMALSLTNIESVSGVDGLEKLEEVELSMSISNKKKNDTLLSSFNNGKQTTAKLTLVNTSLEQGDQETQNITFNKREFRKLKLLTVDCAATTEVVFASGSAPKLEKIICSSSTSATTKVAFTRGSTPKLEKIVWSSSTSLSGIEYLPKLMELEFNGDLVPEVVKEAIKNRKNKVNLKHIKPEIQDQAKEDEQEDDEDAAWFSLFCWKKQV